MKHILGCPQEADPRNETCDCARLRHPSLIDIAVSLNEQFDIPVRRVCVNTMVWGLPQGNRAQRRRQRSNK